MLFSHYSTPVQTLPPQPLGSAETRTQPNEEDLWEFHLGQGIDDTIDPAKTDDRSRQHCSEGIATVTLGGSTREDAWQTRTFYSSSTRDIERRSRTEFNAEISGPKIGASLKASVDESEDFGRDNFLLHVVTRFWKVTRSFEPEPGTGYTHENNACDSGDGAGDIEEFTEKCGTTYVSSQKLGGWMMLTLEVKTSNVQTRKSIAGSLGLNLGSNTEIGLSTVNSVLSEYSPEISSVYMNTTGLTAPPDVTGLDIDNGDQTSPDSGVYTVTLEDVVEYQEKLTSNLHDSFDPENPHLAAYGVVLDSFRSPYSDTQLSECGIEDSEIQAAYNCASKSFDTIGRLRNNQGSLQQMVAQIQQYLDYDEDYNFNGDVQQTKQDLSRLQAKINHCKNSVTSEVADDCGTAIENENPEKLCGKCTAHKECDLGAITTQYNSLTDGITRKRGGTVEHTSYSYRGNGAKNSQGATNATLCVLQKVNGKYSTKKDSVRLKESSTGRWKLEISEKGANSRPSEYRHSSRMACVGRDEFHDHSRPNSDDATVPDFQVGSEIKMGERAYYQDDPAPMGLGINGNYEDNNKLARAISHYNGTSHGLGERVQVGDTSESDESPTWELMAHSAAAPETDHDDGIIGSAHTFGFPDSDAVEPITRRVNVATNGHAEEKLIGLDEGICYLTKVSGEFDGAGEKASVYAGSYFWHLEVGSVCHSPGARFFGQSDCDRKEIEAQARCYKYDH